MSEQLEIGTEVRVLNQQGTYIIRGYNKDGSYCLYGGTISHRSFRDAMPNRVRPVKAKKVKQS
jgi:hypothetical protein